MQATKADIKHHKNKGDEESINFRPSPNFKHMKKYLKSKFEEGLSNGSSSGEQEFSSSVEREEEEEERKVNNSASEMVQPPLPPNPPPPDSPLQITLKTEIEDDEYQNNSDEQRNQSDDCLNEYKPNTSDNPDQKEKVMCRQFARGMCTRGAACIYAHELIVDQLPGVYTFCKNFQNSGCSFPKCKFVHATVFEKECFYRTGYLPPHSIAHLKESNSVPAAPTAPIPEAGAPAEVPAVFPNPPPAIIHPGVGVGSPGAPVPLAAAAAAAVVGGEARPAAAAISPLKRDWLEVDDFGGSPREPELSEPLVKKCKKCDLVEFRLQCNKNKVEKLIRSTQELNKKTSLISKKYNKLHDVLIALFKTSNTAKSAGLSLFNNNVGLRSDKIVDKLNMFFSSSNRHSLTNEDNSNKNMNISTVLVRMLLNTGESAGDSS